MQKVKNILVVEDSKTINKIIAKELKSLGFYVSQAFTLKEAREFLKKNIYDLIILDLHLPDGEGSELIANIQSLTKTKVVVLTSLQDEELREELFSFGIIDYILKDTNLLYSISEVVKVIHSIEKKNGRNILAIDDSKFICKQIETTLEPRNYNVDFARTGKDGLDKIFNNNYELLILDVELPDINGLRVLNIIRSRKRYNSMPIIVLTGTASADIVRELLKNGANDIVKKPFIFEEFILKVDLWIDYFNKSKEIKDKNEKLKNINKNLEVLVSEEVEKNRQKDHIMFSQSRQAQMGEMIAMIAHQWRQPLNIISTANMLLLQKARLNKLNKKTIEDVCQKISTSIRYMSETIDDFRNFFKPDKKKSVTNFEKIIEKAYQLVRGSLEHNGIDFIVKKREVEDFETYENELVQVLLNLIKNAEDALKEKNTDKKYIKVTIDKNRLTVEDNAGGIPVDIIDKIFDPYFSTKSKKEGTGLGLYMSKIIIEEHCKGKLLVENNDKGARFTIII